MDFSGDDFYDDEVTSGRFDDDPNPYDGTYSEADEDDSDPFDGMEDAGYEEALFGADC